MKSTKGRRSRRVPLANRVLPLVLAMAEGKEPDDLLFTTQGGAQLHRTSVLRAVDWRTTGQGRRIHDLRHTAACLWLARSVDPGTVQAWMGHESITTTNLYLHFLGRSAHRAAWIGSTCRGAARGRLSAHSRICRSQRGSPMRAFAEVRAASGLEPPVGIEPTTFSLRVRRSTD